MASYHIQSGEVLVLDNSELFNILNGLVRRLLDLPPCPKCPINKRKANPPLKQIKSIIACTPHHALELQLRRTTHVGVSETLVCSLVVTLP
jgi:hypothetical protein